MKLVDLKERAIVYLKPRAPFSFDGTVFIPAHFPTPDFLWQKNLCWQTIRIDDKLLGLKMENKGTTYRPKIKLIIYSEKKLSDKELENLMSELNWRYGFDEDLSDFTNIFRNDKFLKPVLRRWAGMRLSCANSLYELIVIGIVLQNATVRRTVQMMNNLFNEYGLKLKFDDRELFVFWSPKDLSSVGEDEIRNLKVGYRAKMIKKISDDFSSGKINELELRKMSTEEAKKEVMTLYGVGPATAQIILSEYLRKHNTFELKGRFWEQKILSRILFGKKLVPDGKIIKELDKRYNNWKGLAFHYLFQDLFWKHGEKRIGWLEKEIRL